MSGLDPDKTIKWIKKGETLRQVSPYHQMAEKTYTLPNGKEKVAFTGIHKPFVVGMALTPSYGVVLVKEFRPGPEQVLVDLPTGEMLPGEDPGHAMARELLEETGYQGDPPILVNRSLVNPYSDQERFTFLIWNAVKVKEPQPDPGEFLETVVMPLERFVREYSLLGKNTSGASVLFCLDRLDLLRI